MTIYSPSGDKRVRKMTIVSKLYENGSLEKNSFGLSNLLM